MASPYYGTRRFIEPVRNGDELHVLYKGITVMTVNKKSIVLYRLGRVGERDIRGCIDAINMFFRPDTLQVKSNLQVSKRSWSCRNISSSLNENQHVVSLGSLGYDSYGVGDGVGVVIEYDECEKLKRYMVKRIDEFSEVVRREKILYRVREETHQELNQETRQETRQELNQETRQETRQELNQETRQELNQETHQETDEDLDKVVNGFMEMLFPSDAKATDEVVKEMMNILCLSEISS